MFSAQGVSSLRGVGGVNIKKVVVIATILLVSLAAIILILVFVVFKRPEIYKPDLQAIFDRSAPVPVPSTSGFYRYVSPEDGSTVINGRYSYAERFYGQYAKVAISFEDGAVDYGVIDRQGEMKIKSSIGEGGVRYVLDVGAWIVDGRLYNGKLEAVSEDGSTVVYAGGGFFLASSKDDKAGNVLDRNGKKAFGCTAQDCKVFPNELVDTNDRYTAVVRDGEKSLLIDLSKGSVIYESDGDNYVTPVRRGLFAVKTDGFVLEKYLFAYDGKLKYEINGDSIITNLNNHNIFEITSGDDNNKARYLDIHNGDIHESRNDVVPDVRLYNFSNYLIQRCDNGLLGLSASNQKLASCSYYDVQILPENVYRYFSEYEDEDLVLAVSEDKTVLHDIKSGSERAKFNGDVDFVENSPYIHVTQKSEDMVYSMFDMSIDPIIVNDGQQIVYGGNYFCVSKNDTLSACYNYNLKKIWEQ